MTFAIERGFYARRTRKAVEEIIEGPILLDDHHDVFEDFFGCAMGDRGQTYAGRNAPAAGW